MSNRPWPKDPRDALRGNFSIAMHHLPVTLFLIFVSAVVAVLTQFGAQDEKADFLFMSSQRHYAEYSAAYDDYEALRSRVTSSGGSVDQMQSILRDLGQIPVKIQRIKELQAALDDPFIDIRKGQVWRLVTPMFLHFGIYHIVGNMIMLWQLGLVLEMRFRPARFLGLVLLVAAISNVSEALWSGHTNFGGMSGVDYGLFGFLLLRGKLHPAPEFQMSSRATFSMLLWLVICFTGAVGPIANAAHVMGLATGAVAGTVNAFLGGGWTLLKRRHEFRSAMSSAGGDSLHRCVVCGRTERKNPDLEFYVGADHQEYCSEHLPKDG